MVNYTVTGEVRKTYRSLVDCLAKGYIECRGDKVPCEIGFTEFSSGLEPTHIFIQDVIVNGHHYYKGTIRL